MIDKWAVFPRNREDSFSAVDRVFPRSLSGNVLFGRKSFLDRIDPAAIEDHLAVGYLPNAPPAIESIDVPSPEHQIDLGAIFFLPSVNGQKVALAAGDVSLDFDQLVGNTMLVFSSRSNAFIAHGMKSAALPLSCP
jgi:hypothetical protein